MDEILRCSDTGFYACDSVMCGQTKDEVMNKFKQHLKDVHFVKEITKELSESAWAGIHEGDCGKETRAEEIFELSGL